ncbi:ABC transporter permease subunit [Virgibacillus dakarensis]|nr:ABC transporter permease subunit [Virgibacillus dakarensis]
MTFSLKRVYAIFQKDLKDLSKNMFVGTSLITPLILALFYAGNANITLEMHYLIINMSFTIVGSFVQCALIAEEKEKNTLRGLMLSPATIPEILSGKSLVTLLLTLAVILICTKVTGYRPENQVLTGIAIFVSALFYIALGTLLGLLTKSVVEASVVILPVFFLFSFGTFVEVLIDKYPQLSFLEYMPNIQLVAMAYKVQKGAEFIDVWTHLGIMLAWVVVTTWIAVFVFRKREMD